MTRTDDIGDGTGRGGAGPGRGGWQQADLPGADDAAAWLAGRLPDGWFTGGAGGHGGPRGDRRRRRRCRRSRASSPRGRRAAPSAPRPRRAGSPGSARTPARSGSRSPARPSTATAARSPGARGSATTEQLFTVASVPVMTRLRQPERVVLDTLVDAGVARSRSDALAWAVGWSAQHADDVAGRAARGDGDGRRAARQGARRRRELPSGGGSRRPARSRRRWQIAASTVAAWKNSW